MKQANSFSYAYIYKSYLYEKKMGKSSNMPTIEMQQTLCKGSR